MYLRSGRDVERINRTKKDTDIPSRGTEVFSTMGVLVNGVDCVGFEEEEACGAIFLRWCRKKGHPPPTAAILYVSKETANRKILCPPV